MSTKQQAQSREVVITGIGVVSPVGIGKSSFWEAVQTAKNGVKEISRLDASSFPCRVAAEIIDFDPNRFLTQKQQKAYTRSAQFAVAAFEMAKADAALEFFDPYRSDVILGAGSLSFEFVDQTMGAHPDAARTFVPGTFDLSGITKYNLNTPAAAIAQSADVRGFVTTVSTACASGLSAIGLAFDRIRSGSADVVVTGATDAPINYFTLHLFASAGFLSEGQVPIEETLCPFDLRRTRSVFGEGACVFVFEEREHALHRGAQPYCTLEAFEQEYENVDELLRTDKSGQKWGELLKRVVSKARGPIDYVNAHATSDKDLDAVEAVALMHALGQEGFLRTPVSSLKGSTGSPFAAAGALQVAATTIAISEKMLPPSYNYKIPDPSCPLQVVKTKQHSDLLRRGLVSTHGFGGVNAALVLGELSV